MKSSPRFKPGTLVMIEHSCSIYPDLYSRGRLVFSVRPTLAIVVCTQTLAGWRDCEGNFSMVLTPDHVGWVYDLNLNLVSVP